MRVEAHRFRVNGDDRSEIDAFGKIDLLVNNAGICGSQFFEDATLEDFDHYWRVHLGGPVNTVKAAWPHMVAQHQGKIILTTSVAGRIGRGWKPRRSPWASEPA